MATQAVSDPVLSADLLERVFAKLGLAKRPSLDLPGLNALYAAFCKGVPADNVRKRIWFASDQAGPLPGADPGDFFESWLKHGTGGTCWPINGAMGALVQSLGFEARRIAGMIIVGEHGQSANHGSVIVTMDDTDHLVDAQIGSFKVLPLERQTPTSTGNGIHDLEAFPLGGAFDVRFYNPFAGSPQERKELLTFRTEPQYDPVDHAFFRSGYEQSFTLSPFNDVLYTCGRFPESIVTVARMNKMVVDSDGTLTTIEVTDLERRRILVEELGFSEQIVEALPPDVVGGVTIV